MKKENRFAKLRTLDKINYHRAHREHGEEYLGPSLLESTYEACLVYECLFNFNVQRLVEGIRRMKI
jgi:hypothetical protein